METGPNATQPLVERWNRVLAGRGDEVAIRQMHAGGDAAEEVTFSQLDGFAEELARELAEQVSYGPVAVRSSWPLTRFVGTVLAAWKAGRAVVLLEEKDEDLFEKGMRLDDQRVALIKRTSGSTGCPRHLLFDAAQVQADVDQLMPTMGLRSDWVNLAAISPAHSYGFSNLVTPLLFHGMSIMAPFSVLPGAVETALGFLREAVGAAGRIVVPAVPAMWRAWLGHDCFKPGDVACAISAGAPLPLPIEQRALVSCGLKIHNFYGSSESGGIAYDQSGTVRPSADHVGTPVHGVRLELDDAGRVAVHSRACAMGVLAQDVSAGGPGVGGGVFRSTDLGRIDSDGWLVLTGRADDLINLAGRKIHPQAVEFRLRADPQVAECLVFGIDAADPTRVHEMVALVRLVDGQRGSALLDTVRRRLAGELPAWQLPRHWRLQPDLAADARGKLSRHLWRQRFIEGGSG